MRALALVALIACGPASAQMGMATGLALGMAAGSGGGSSKVETVPAKRLAGTCLWQVPGLMRWVNIASLQGMSVTEKGGAQTILSFGRYEGDVSVVHSGQAIDSVANSVLARLAECGKKS